MVASSYLFISCIVSIVLLAPLSEGRLARLPQFAPALGEFDLKCSTCEIITAQLFKILPLNATSDQIKKILTSICNITGNGTMNALCQKAFGKIPVHEILKGLVYALQVKEEYSPRDMCAFFSICKVDCCLSNNAPEQIHIGLTNDPATQLVVMWVTQSVGQPVVYYGLSPSRGPNKVVASTGTYTRGGWRGSIHTAILTGLTPDTLYYYQVGDSQSNSFSPLYSFKTYSATPRPSLIASIGDLGTGNSSAETMRSLTRLVGQRGGNIDLLVHAGDLAYSDGIERIFDEYFRQASTFLPYVPYMVAPGNHEALHGFAGFTNRFHFPYATSKAPGNLYYSFDYGWVHFVIFNMDGPIEKSLDLPIFPPEEMAWVKQDLAAANANRANVPWIIFMTHRNLYCVSHVWFCHSATALARTMLEPILSANRVDLVLTGHVHNYQRMYPVLNSTVYRSYANPPYPVHIVNGAGGNREGILGIPADETPPWLVTALPVRGYGLLQVDSPQQLMWKFYQSDTDKLLDSFTLTKQAKSKIN